MVAGDMWTFPLGSLDGVRSVLLPCLTESIYNQNSSTLTYIQHWLYCSPISTTYKNLEIKNCYYKIKEISKVWLNKGQII